jgi:hypothetical protein
VEIGVLCLALWELGELSITGGRVAGIRGVDGLGIVTVGEDG